MTLAKIIIAAAILGIVIQIVPYGHAHQNPPVTSDVNEGREHLNVSEWDRTEEHHGDEAAEMVEKDEMPLWFYLPLHPEARLSPADKKRLIQGLERTFGSEHHDH